MCSSDLQFIGEDYYDNLFEYHFFVNHGYGVPPGLVLDPYSGWYYGTLPPIGETQITYSFNIQVRARSLVIYSTNSGTNTIVCDSSTRGDFYVGSPVTFEGDVVGGLADDTTYYVESIVSDTEFTVSVDHDENFVGVVFQCSIEEMGAGHSNNIVADRVRGGIGVAAAGVKEECHVYPKVFGSKAPPGGVTLDWSFMSAK
mgnify:CR=1 FL=1